MKTKYKRFGKSAVSLLLSVLMLVSSMMLGAISTIEAHAVTIGSTGRYMIGESSIQRLEDSTVTCSWSRTENFRLIYKSDSEYFISVRLKNGISNIFRFQKSDGTNYSNSNSNHSAVTPNDNGSGGISIASGYSKSLYLNDTTLDDDTYGEYRIHFQPNRWVWIKKLYSITKDCDTTKGSMTVSPDYVDSTDSNGVTYAEDGESITVRITANTGYEVTSAKIGTTNITLTQNGNIYTGTCKMPKSNATISATFATTGNPEYSTTVNQTGGTVSTITNCVSGTPVTFTVTPPSTYEVDTVTGTYGSGSTLEITDNNDGTYSYTMPAGNVTINITYKATASTQFTTTVNQTGGTVSTINPCVSGTNVSFTVTPPTNCAIASVTGTYGSGSPVTITNNGSGSYSYTMPAGDVTLNITYNYTVYFVNTNSWTSVKAYAFKNTSEETLLGGWSGTAMTLVDASKKKYSITIPYTDEGETVIFNGSGGQTVNIVIRNSDNSVDHKGETWTLVNEQDSSNNYKGSWPVTENYYLRGDAYKSIDGNTNATWDNNLDVFKLALDSTTGDYAVDVKFIGTGNEQNYDNGYKGFKVLKESTWYGAYWTSTDDRTLIKASDVTPSKTNINTETCRTAFSSDTKNFGLDTSCAVNANYRVFFRPKDGVGGHADSVGTIYIKPLHTITVEDARTSGTDATASVSYAAYGDTVSVTAYKNGDLVPYVSLNGSLIAFVQEGSTDKYVGTFTMPAADTKISVNYHEKSNFNVTTVRDVTSGNYKQGNYSPDTLENTTQQVTEGDTVTLTAAPNAGYTPKWSFSNNDFAFAEGDETSTTIKITPARDITVYLTFETEFTATEYEGTGAYLFGYTSKPQQEGERANGKQIPLYVDDDNNLFAKLEVGDTEDLENGKIIPNEDRNGQYYFAYSADNNTENTKDKCNNSLNGKSVTFKTGSASNYLNQYGYEEGKNAGSDGIWWYLKIYPKTTCGAVYLYIGTVSGSTVTFRSTSDAFMVDAQEGDVRTSSVATIKAKSGTVRDEGSRRRFARWTDISMTYEDTGASVKTTDSNYYTTLDANSNTIPHYELKTAKALINRTIRVTATIHDTDARARYYIKGFNVCVNDECQTLGIVNGASSDGTYTMTFTPTSASDVIEITPVYYWREDFAGHPDLVTLKIKGFDEKVRKVWGNTIAAYVWYADNNEAFDNKVVGSTQDAFGGYPGQPLINESGQYSIQVPLKNNNGAAIKGVLLNNYVLDEVHSTVSNKANAQSYDYDDFIKLSTLSDIESITFEMKYHADNAVTDNEYSGNYTNVTTGTIMSSTANEWNTNTNLDDTSKFATTWYALSDINDVPVDLFGNRIEVTETEPGEAITGHRNYTAYMSTDEKHYYNNDYVLTGITGNNKYYVVSDGYVNYYTGNSNTNPLKANTNKYLGEYATMWHVYEYTDTNKYKLIGSLPPSAFITDTDYKTAYGITDGTALTAASSISDVPDAFLNYSDQIGDNARLAMWNQFVAIYNKCYNKPVQIKYEASIQDNGATGEGATNNKGYRCDGRWYYSRATVVHPIQSNIRIWIKDSTATSHYIFKNVTDLSDDSKSEYYVEDPFGTTNTDTGVVTGAFAHYTNENVTDYVTEETISNKTSATVLKDSSKTFNFASTSLSLSGKTYSIKNDGTVEVASEPEDVKYKFVGWYLYSESNKTMTKMDQAYVDMSENSTIIAVYEPSANVSNASTKTLTVVHDLYANKSKYATQCPDGTNEPGIGNTSNGTPYITVTIVDGENEYYDDGQGTVMMSESVSNDATVTISLYTTITDSKTKVYKETVNSVEIPGVYYYDSTQTRKFTLPADSGIYTYDADKKDTGVVTYTTTVGELFGSDSSKTMYFFTNLFRSYINMTVRYYDRDLTHNKAMDMSEKTNTVNITDDIDQNTTIGELDLTKFSVTNNPMDQYTWWMTQELAIAGIKGYTDYHNSSKKYSARNAEDSVYAAHTDAHGNLLGDTGYSANGAKWVTYYDAAGKELNITSTDATVENISRIELWLYNYPKTYAFKAAYTPDGTAAAPKLTKLDGADLYLGNDGNFATFTETGKAQIDCFYNQRIGKSDGTDNTLEKNKGTAYLTSYGISSPFAGTSEGVEVKAVETAKSTDNLDLVFDGWYTKDANGKFTLLCTDRSYQNRITNALEIYALYRPAQVEVENEMVATTGTSVAVSVSNVQTDGYVDANGVKNVRINTQLNVTGEDIVEDDPNIRYVASLYFSLPEKDASGNKIEWSATNRSIVETYLKDNADTIRGYIENHTKALDKQNKFDVTDVSAEGEDPEYVANDVPDGLYHTTTTKAVKNGDAARPLYSVALTFAVEDVRTVNGVVDCFTYKVIDSSAGTSSQVNLTNKNRTQFTLLMTEDELNSSAFVAFAAIKYMVDNDVENTANKWYISDNCVSYVAGASKTFDANDKPVTVASGTAEDVMDCAD